MSVIKKYIEEETSFGFNEGTYGTVTSSADIAIPELSDVGGIIRPEPYPPTIMTVDSSSFRIIGFAVEWQEKLINKASPWREKVVVYVQ
ncbi:MAG: hypothetical protein PHP46_00095 [Candidatus Omnitrophica bacterium]|nr:hypothetical protein [Candidatus Omnitrophota bacterium]